MRVLVVDDEARFADGLRRGLEAEGCAVDVAHNGVDGLWYAQEFGYDVIILDWMMPQMNGWKVLAALRGAEDWTPVIMLTARDADRDQVEALGSGADDYVTKPFSFAVLMARVRNLGRRGAVERPDVLEAGSLRLDPGTHIVHRGDTEIELTSREFAVLEYLMRHRDLVVSKLDVLSGVWDEAFDGDPNIVEVYIGHLRRKVDRPFGTSSIRTVRGAGYRLVDDG